MMGIIPSGSKTYEVAGKIGEPPYIEGKLYFDGKTERLYLYSTSETRSCPATGYFPIFDGNRCYESEFSAKKYLKDMIDIDLKRMVDAIDDSSVMRIQMQHRKSEDAEILQPSITDGDNMFTQCIKGTIVAKRLTMADLYDMACPPLSTRALDNYYASLTKVVFMRLEKWHIWTDLILHVGYTVRIFRDGTPCLVYTHGTPESFDVDHETFKDIIDSNRDPFKKIVLILIRKEKITKSDLKSDTVDDYTINNMMTTLSGTKSMSAQLFSRFLRMAKFNYQVEITEGEKTIFTYRE